MTTTEADIDGFLNSPSDKLQMTGIPPPGVKLQKLDTSTAPRWPSAAEINSRMREASQARDHPTRPKRDTKDLIVRFTDQVPEEIGFGGDEEEAPTIQISSNKALNRKRQTQEDLAADSGDGGGRSHSQHLPPETRSEHQSLPQRQVDEVSGRIRELSLPSHDGTFQDVSNQDFSSSGSIVVHVVEPPEPSSFTAQVQAEMRAAEGMSLRNSVLLGPISPTVSEASDEAIIPEPRDMLPGAGFQTAGARINAPEQVTQGDSLAPGGPREAQKSPAWSLRDVALAVKDDALDDFMSRIQHMFSLFHVSAESYKPLASIGLEQLLAAAAWWFLKGRASLEATIRERNSNPEVQNVNQSARQQAFADLAKALWIVKFVSPRSVDFKQYHHQESRDAQATDLLEMHNAILSALNKLMISMKRNQILPPGPGQASPAQGLDTSIWKSYPDFTPDIASLLSNNGKGSLVTTNSRSVTLLSEIMPLADTRRSFNFGRMFVDGFLMEEGIESQQFRCPCVLSISRGQNESQISLHITSQNLAIKLKIQSDKSAGLTWKDIQWRPRSNALELKLPRGFLFKVQCLPHDFATVYGIYDYTNKMLSTMNPFNDENLLFETDLVTFAFYAQNPQSRAFPKEPVSNCRVWLLEKRITKTEGTGARSLHRGFRIVVLTSPRTKTLSGINIELHPVTGPIQYAFVRGESGAPALLIKIQHGKLEGMMAMTFRDPQERAQLHDLLTASSLANAEACFANCQLLNLSISQPGQPTPIALRSLKWQNATVLNEDGLEAGVESTKTVLSEQLRVVINVQNGSITDRINVGKGELKLRLNAGENRNELQLLRNSQEDLTIAIFESQFPRQLPGELAELLKMIAESANTVRSFQFPTLVDLHRFQAAVTGFTILFDGTAASFAISRRRMVVPIYKKWDATTTRLQIIRRDKIVQLMAFFNNFSHGECMNFALKGTDNFETTSKAGKYTLKIVDAKFALPKGGDGKEKGSDVGIEKSFICLDMPDYAGEHDDITITFDSQEEHEKFTKALPAQAKLASRMGSIRH